MDVNVKTHLDRPFDERSQPRKRATRADGAIFFKSRSIHAALAQASLVAPMNTTVLLHGETGVGKEVFAKAIHNASPRRYRPMISFNPAAVPDTLIESELFGRERGAFTGAVSRQLGRFEAASGSTIFLDEIVELSPNLQVKLLRVLDRRTIERLGCSESIAVDIRVIAATNRNLEEAVNNHQFRKDLFYRLNVFSIRIPPLRERLEDIPDLAWTFIHEFSHAYGKKIESIAPESLSELQQYSWPGNIRELRNVIERAMILARTSTLTPVVPRPRSFSLSGSTQRYPVQAV